MAEYIEREVALESLMYAMCGTGFQATAMREIRRIPAANVAPVVHGRWKYYRKQGVATCTICSFERKLDDDFGRAVSCPNCGAKMDKKEI